MVLIIESSIKEFLGLVSRQSVITAWQDSRNICRQLVHITAWQELSSHFCSWLDLEVSLSGWLARTELVMIRRLIQILGQWNSYVVTCNDSSTWLVWYACTTAAHYVRQYTHVGGQTSSLVFFHLKGSETARTGCSQYTPPFVRRTCPAPWLCWS